MIELRDPSLLRVAAVALAVLAAYLVRRRARRVEVPFLPLWRGVTRQGHGGFGARLVRHLDLLLVLLACAALAVAAADPYVPGRPSTVRDLVLVLDGGVELRAGQRADRLRRAAEAEIRRRARGTRFAVVGAREGGSAVTTTDDPRAALRAVEAHDPGWLPVDPAPALALGRAAARSLRDPDLVFCTCRPVEADGYRQRTIVEPAPDAAVESLEVLADPEGEGRLLRVRLRAEGEVSIGDAWKGTVDGTREVTVPLRGSGQRTLEVRGRPDRFPVDDALYLVLPESRAPAVLVVADGEPSTFLVAALEALERIGAVRGPLERTTPARAVDAAERADLLVFDRCAPSRPSAGLRAVYLDPPGGALPFSLGPPADAPAFFDLKEDHPLLRGFDLTRIPPLRARAVLGGEAVARAAPGPALAAGPHWVALGFDPDRCLLAASPAYPLLLRNAIEWLAQDAAVREPEFYVMGERTPAAPGESVVRPDGTTRRSVERFSGPPGFWRVGERTVGVNLLAEGLDLRAASPAAGEPPAVGSPAVPETPLTRAFAAGALAVLLLAWWLFWRGPS